MNSTSTSSSDVETTGASSEFYDKFNIRRSIQVIFRSLWESAVYKSIMINYARFVELCCLDCSTDQRSELSSLKCEIKKYET